MSARARSGVKSPTGMNPPAEDAVVQRARVADRVADPPGQLWHGVGVGQVGG